jgi:hypothetical protein
LKIEDPVPAYTERNLEFRNLPGDSRTRIKHPVPATVRFDRNARASFRSRRPSRSRWMRGDGPELGETGYSEAPTAHVLCRLLNGRSRAVVLGITGMVGVDQDIGVEGITKRPAPVTSTASCLHG